MSGSAYQERMEQRKADFKRGIDGEEARRRRDDQQVSIRKNKREDMLAKRRQHEAEVSSPAADAGANTPSKHLPLDMQSMLAKFYGSNFEEVLEATTHFRKILSLEKSPPIQKVIDAGVVPKLVYYCTALQYPKLQYEAAWALTNIASGTSDQTRVVIDAGAIPVFVQLLQSPDENVREQCVWALGNIAGDSPANRDLVLRCNTLPALVENLHRTSKTSMLRNGTWALSNMARGKPQPEFCLVSGALPILSKLIHSTDTEVLTDACWAVSYISDGGSERVDAILKCDMVKQLVQLMTHSNPSIQTPALRTIGNIATGDDKQTNAVVQAGALPFLGALMRTGKKALKKEAVWTISNVAAGTQEQIEAIKQANVLPEVVQQLANGEWEVKKEAVWAVCNYCSGGTPEQIRFLVRSCKAMKPLCDALTFSDVGLLKVVLDALASILKSGEPDSNNKVSVNPYTDMIEDCDGLDKIEELQSHQSTKVYQKAVDIIERFFSDPEAPGENMEGLAPNMQQSGGFQFSGSFQFQNPQQPQQCGQGFNFGSPAPQQQQPQANVFGGGGFNMNNGGGFGTPSGGFNF